MVVPSPHLYEQRHAKSQDPIGSRLRINSRPATSANTFISLVFIGVNSRMNLPTTRSRTSLFLSFRESRAPASRYSHASGADDADDVDDDEQQGLIPQSRRHHAIDLDLPPKWSALACCSLHCLLLTMPNSSSSQG